MKTLFDEGLAKMQAGEIDDRMSRRPIERYQWPLAAGLVLISYPLHPPGNVEQLRAKHLSHSSDVVQARVTRSARLTS